MDSEIVIEVENLSKQYRLGKIGTGSLVHDLNRWWHKVKGLEDPYLKVGVINDRSIKHDSEYVWALRDVNFNVKRGEVLGVIGKNGAGKSTLLKLLSQVTSPTKGLIKVKGRIASLLEVGTGFHPELSGRENVFLNGAILGMSKAEIKRKFDQIVDFSGVGRYLDTPVKRYSSGMYVRLAFAVAAHLEPEILIVDEVLAVGDAEFQKKCLGKMKDVSGEGRTVIFVSHNMPSVLNLCSSSILMKNGMIADSGPTAAIVEKYYAENSKITALSISERTDRVGNRAIQVVDFYLLNKQKSVANSIIAGEEVSIILEINNPSSDILKNVKLAVAIDNHLENRILHLNNDLLGKEVAINPGSNKFVFSMSKVSLLPGEYSLSFFCSVNGEIADWLTRALNFTIEEGDYYNNGKGIINRAGLIYADFDFYKV